LLANFGSLLSHQLCATAEIDLVFAQGTPDVLHVDVAQDLRDQRSVPTGKAFGGRPIEHRTYLSLSF